MYEHCSENKHLRSLPPLVKTVWLGQSFFTSCRSASASGERSAPNSSFREIVGGMVADLKDMALCAAA